MSETVVVNYKDEQCCGSLAIKDTSFVAWVILCDAFSVDFHFMTNGLARRFLSTQLTVNGSD